MTDNIDSIPRVGVPQYILRRLSDRGMAVLERHKGRHPAVETAAAAFVPIGRAYNAAYDAVRAISPRRSREIGEGREALNELRQTGRTWVSQLRRDLPALEFEEFTRTNVVFEDLLAGTERLLQQLADHPDQPAYFEQAAADIGAAKEAANKEWTEAQDLLATFQSSQGEVRRLAVELQSQLVSLRRVLALVIGKKHRDYQKLRLPEARIVDEEDADAQAGEAEPGTLVAAPVDELPEATQTEEREAG